MWIELKTPDTLGGTRTHALSLFLSLSLSTYNRQQPLLFPFCSPWIASSRFSSLVPASTRADPSIRGGRGSLTRRAIKAIRSVLSWNNVTLQRAGYVDKCYLCVLVRSFSLSLSLSLFSTVSFSLAPRANHRVCHVSLSLFAGRFTVRARFLHPPFIYYATSRARVCLHARFASRFHVHAPRPPQTRRDDERDFE